MIRNPRSSCNPVQIFTLQFDWLTRKLPSNSLLYKGLFSHWKRHRCVKPRHKDTFSPPSPLTPLPSQGKCFLMTLNKHLKLHLPPEWRRAFGTAQKSVGSRQSVSRCLGTSGEIRSSKILASSNCLEIRNQISRNNIAEQHRASVTDYGL